jgi:integrase
MTGCTAVLLDSKGKIATCLNSTRTSSPLMGAGVGAGGRKVASFEQRSSGWRAAIKRKGIPRITATFDTKRDAMAWARAKETELDQGVIQPASRPTKISEPPAAPPAPTLAEIVERYRDTVTPRKRGAPSERSMLAGILKTPMAKRRLDKLTKADVQRWYEQRRQTHKAASCNRVLWLLTGVINHAREEWGVALAKNPFKIRADASEPARNVILSDDELQRLLDAADPLMRLIIEFCCELPIRASNLRALRWSDVVWDGPSAGITLHSTKNGDRHVLPLTAAAREILLRAKEQVQSPDGRIFPLGRRALQERFSAARRRAGLEHYRLHDTRHQSLTAWADALGDSIRLAKVSGHRNLSVLSRYVNPSPATLAALKPARQANRPHRANREGIAGTGTS